MTASATVSLSLARLLPGDQVGVDSFHGCEIEGRPMQNSRSVVRGRRFQFAVHYPADAAVYLPDYRRMCFHESQSHPPAI